MPVKEGLVFLIQPQQEGEELAWRIERLEAFVGSAAWSELTDHEKDLLESQLIYMKAYGSVLRQRLKLRDLYHQMETERSGRPDEVEPSGREDGAAS
jgi:hypothetical protein